MNRLAYELDARGRDLPACLECDAARATPCTTIPGGAIAREPHRVRERMSVGEVFAIVITPETKSSAIKRAIGELAAVIAVTRSKR